jgi:hypothetical protein
MAHRDAPRWPVIRVESPLVFAFGIQAPTTGRRIRMDWARNRGLHVMLTGSWRSGGGGRTIIIILKSIYVKAKRKSLSSPTSPTSPTCRVQSRGDSARVWAQAMSPPDGNPVLGALHKVREQVCGAVGEAARQHRARHHATRAVTAAGHSQQPPVWRGAPAGVSTVALLMAQCRAPHPLAIQNT